MFLNAKVLSHCANIRHTKKYSEKMTKLIIFDLDGTLLDTREDIARGCNHALRACGYPEHDTDDFNRMVGRGIYNMLLAAMPEECRCEDRLEVMVKHFMPYYHEHIADFTVPYPGIMELMDKLSEEGIRIAVASNKYQSGTEALIEKFFGKYDLLKVLGQRDGYPIKPDPGVILEIMEDMPGLKKEEVVYCGDSDVDMQTGNNAGVRTIGVTWGFRSREELLANNPWLLADNVDDILSAVLK